MVSGGIRAAIDRPSDDVDGNVEAGGGVSQPSGAGHHPNSPWTKERVEQLIKLHEEGISSSIIGDRMGLTRNQVIGKLHRLGVCRPRPEIRKARAGGPKRSDGKPRRDGSGTIIRFRPRQELFKERAAALIPLGIELADLDPMHCRYPYGEGPYTFCGHKKMEGSSYCPDHFALTWQPKWRA